MQPALLVGKLTFLNDAHPLLQPHLPDASVDPDCVTSLYSQLTTQTSTANDG